MDQFDDELDDEFDNELRGDICPYCGRVMLDDMEVGQGYCVPRRAGCSPRGSLQWLRNGYVSTARSGIGVSGNE